MKNPVLILLAALGLAACSSNMPAGTAVLGDNPALGGGTFTSPGGLTVAVDARNIGGRTGICGVWAESINQSVMTRNSGPRILASGGVVLGGEAVAQGLGFLRNVDPATSYAGLEANCITTERAWRAGDEARELRIILPRQIVENQLDGDFGESGGILIWFRPGGPGAHPSDKKPWYHLDGTGVSGSLDQ
ncbi:hypothetical protein DC366_05495 [Pelagivirga sediminicola]|uniref:Uncharacterized protein n=1 Tax=Pelagivirga sediminicola TaxID=2170575 RepID=A0A2T7G9W2_9RHOB|nr:hypothetical protein [Pelagivirga sediminicola]PVA11210.1 hypothetical protein DC366_05495 [Pelagivirga sediminicola]